MSKIMTAEEWAINTDAGKITDYKDEFDLMCKFGTAYAEYYHAEMSKPPKDVEDAIDNYCVNYDVNNPQHMLLEMNIRRAIRFGYSLANKPPIPNK